MLESNTVHAWGRELTCHELTKRGYLCRQVEGPSLHIEAVTEYGEKLGITVCARFRREDFDEDRLVVSQDLIGKLKSECRAKGLIPCLALVIEGVRKTKFFLVPLERASQINTVTSAALYWKTNPQRLKEYRSDPSIITASWSLN